MRKEVLLFPALLMILLVAGSCGGSESATEPEAAPPLEVAKFRVEVSRHGYDGNDGVFELHVTQSQEVEITFVYGDGDLDKNNPHQLYMANYGIKSEVLDRDNPEVTLKFTALSAGRVSFKCVIKTSDGYDNLQGGRVVPKIQPVR